jgi:hypothetical protein
MQTKYKPVNRFKKLLSAQWSALRDLPIWIKIIATSLWILPFGSVISALFIVFWQRSRKHSSPNKRKLDF